ncbi:MAG: hypothetical protein IIC35_01475 [Gemmatimonadetes bacterium]|nr:hypothetical protein [Gemmatimonadota bacterium]
MRHGASISVSSRALRFYIFPEGVPDPDSRANVMQRNSRKAGSIALTALFFTACGGSSTLPDRPSPPDPDAEERSYSDIVGENAISDDGLFLVH